MLSILCNECFTKTTLFNNHSPTQCFAIFRIFDVILESAKLITFFRVATVLENPEIGKKISFFNSKYDRNMLLVKIFLIRQCCKTKTATSQGLIFV